MTTQSVAARTINSMEPHRDTDHLYQLLVAVQADLASLQASFNQLRTDYNAHVHGGVTAGAANTSVVTSSTAAAVTLNTLP